MELRRLRYFSTVAEEMHVTRAAERLGLAQPALTQQIRALEAELGVKLLEKSGRGVALTPAGEVFRREAAFILDRCAKAAVLARDAQSGLLGRLAIGLTDTASFTPAVTGLLKRAREAWPRVDFKLDQGRAADLLNSLVNGADDVAFIRSPTQDEGLLHWQPFTSEGFMLVAPHGHALADRPWVEPRDLDGEDFIIPRGRSPERDRHGGILFDLAALGHRLRLVQRTPEYVTAINLVAAGFGLALVPEVLSGLRSEAVVYRPLRAPQPLTTQLFVVSRREDRSPVVGNFRALAKALASCQVERPFMDNEVQGQDAHAGER